MTQNRMLFAATYFKLSSLTKKDDTLDILFDELIEAINILLDNNFLRFCKNI